VSVPSAKIVWLVRHETVPVPRSVLTRPGLGVGLPYGFGSGSNGLATGSITVPTVVVVSPFAGSSITIRTLGLNPPSWNMRFVRSRHENRMISTGRGSSLLTFTDTATSMQTPG
jgi:hypothetical protein